MKLHLADSDGTCVDTIVVDPGTVVKVLDDNRLEVIPPTVVQPFVDFSQVKIFWATARYKRGWYWYVVGADGGSGGPIRGPHPTFHAAHEEFAKEHVK